MNHNQFCCAVEPWRMVFRRNFWPVKLARPPGEVRWLTCCLASISKLTSASANFAARWQNTGHTCRGWIWSIRQVPSGAARPIPSWIPTTNAIINICHHVISRPCAVWSFGGLHPRAPAARWQDSPGGVFKGYWPGLYLLGRLVTWLSSSSASMCSVELYLS